MDYKEVQDKYPDSLSQLNLDEILTNGKHWELNFSVISDSVKEMWAVLNDLELYDYRSALPRWTINEIDWFRGNIIQYVNLIKDFSISQQNASEIRNSYINQINSFYNNNFYRIEEILNNLKIKNLLSKNESKKILDEKTTLTKEIDEVRRLRKDLENWLKDLKAANNAWEWKGAETASHYFSQSITTTKISSWENSRRKFWVAMIVWSIILGISYFLVVNFFWNNFANKIELWVVGIIWFILLYFGFSFATNNYYIEKSLLIENSHRKNIIDTYPLLTNADPNEESKSLIRLEAVKSIFAPIWQKIEWRWAEISTPFFEIIKGLIWKINW